MFLNEAMKSSYIQVSVLFIRYIFRAAVHRNLPEGGPENNHAGCAPAGGGCRLGGLSFDIDVQNIRRGYLME